MATVVLMILGGFLLGVSVGLMVTYHLMKKSDQEWKVVISRLETDHEQEIQKINKDWEAFAGKVAGLKLETPTEMEEVE